MISDKEFLKDRDILYPLSDEQKANMVYLLAVINRLSIEWGKPMIVTSGYRDPATNKACGGAPGSDHLTCKAIDILDSDGSFYKWITDNDILEKYDLYREDFAHTQTHGKNSWVHLTINRKKVRTFKP